MTAPRNYTTSIGATKTVGEVQARLAKYGADAVAVTYTEGRPTGVTFMLTGSHFRLPVDIDAMHALLRREGNAGRLGGLSRSKWDGREQAERVAWRVVKDWVDAQLALVDASMVSLDEVMLPYLVVGKDTLLRDQWRNRQALTMGDSA